MTNLKIYSKPKLGGYIVKVPSKMDSERVAGPFANKADAIAERDRLLGK